MGGGGEGGLWAGSGFSAFKVGGFAPSYMKCYTEWTQRAFFRFSEGIDDSILHVQFYKSKFYVGDEIDGIGLARYQLESGHGRYAISEDLDPIIVSSCVSTGAGETDAIAPSRTDTNSHWLIKVDYGETKI